MKKAVLVCLLLGSIILCTFSSCADNSSWDSWESCNDSGIKLIYQAEGYTPTANYLTVNVYYTEPSWTPKFMGFPLITFPHHSSYIINSDLTVVHSDEKPSDELQAKFAYMTRVDSTDKSVSTKFIRQINHEKLAELQQFSFENLSVISYLSLDTGHFVWFNLRLDGELVYFLAELSPEGTFLRIFSTSTIADFGDSIRINVN